MAGSWVRIDFLVATSEEDDVTTRLHEAGLPGWEVIESEGNLLTLRVWVLPEDADRVSAAIGPLARSYQPAVQEPLEDTWSDGWRPITVGPFVITSVGAPETPIRPEQYRILLAPALAFGGGEHPTTRLSLHAMNRHLRPGSMVLDVGSGSGVLSVAAARLGATRVDAVDVDPTARRATARAALASEVDVRVPEDGLAAARGPYDLVVANILGPVLIQLAPDLLERIAGTGRLILSGIRAGAERAVVERFKPLEPIETTSSDGWVSVVLGV